MLQRTAGGGLPAVPPMAVGSGAKALKQSSPDGSSGDSGGSDGYVFSPEEIDEVLKQWENLLEGLEEDEGDAQRIKGVQAPGLEFASGDYVSAANGSGEALVTQIQEMHRYVSNYVAALRKAKEATAQQDQESAASIPGTES